MRQRSVKTQYFGVWHALFKLSCVNGEKSENSSMIQQETRLRKQRGEEKTIEDPTVPDIAESLLLDTDEEDVSNKIPPRTVLAIKTHMYIIEFCAYHYFEARKQVWYLICLTAVFSVAIQIFKKTCSWRPGRVSSLSHHVHISFYSYSCWLNSLPVTFLCVKIGQFKFLFPLQ